MKTETALENIVDDRDGRAVVVNGSHVLLRFRSGYSGSYGRFRLLFTPVYRKYNNKIY